MLIKTSRFGPLEVASEDVLTFPAGMIGLEECREWVLLADAQNEALGWLQSLARPEIAFAVVSPRRFLPHYQLRVYRSELAPLSLSHARDAQVLAVVGKHEDRLTLNLKAPIVVNLESRLGRQVIANGEPSTRYELSSPSTPWKKSA